MFICILFKYFLLCLYVCLYGYICVYVQVFSEVQKSVSDTLNLEVQVTVSHQLMWFLGIELWSYENAASSLNLWAVAPVPAYTYFIHLCIWSCIRFSWGKGCARGKRLSCSVVDLLASCGRARSIPWKRCASGWSVAMSRRQRQFLGELSRGLSAAIIPRSWRYHHDIHRNPSDSPPFKWGPHSLSAWMLERKLGNGCLKSWNCTPWIYVSIPYFKNIYPLFLFMCICIYLPELMCTTYMQVPQGPEGIWSPRTGVTSCECLMLSAGNQTLVLFKGSKYS